MTYTVSLAAYNDTDEVFEEYENQTEATEKYNELLKTFNEENHLYLQLAKVDETEYRPKTKVIKLHQPA